MSTLRLPYYYLAPRLLDAGVILLMTIGVIVLTYLNSTSSTDNSTLRISAAQTNGYQSISELANKRQLIVALQSIRMHNVTRYQRKTSQNLQQSPFSLFKTDDTLGDFNRISSVPILNKNNVKSSPPSVAPVMPVQHGW